MAPAINPKAPMSLRLTESDEEWLKRAASEAGVTTHAFLRQLVADARAASGQPQETSR